MNETGRDAGLVPVDRRTTPRRWLLLAVPALVLVLGALAAVVVPRDTDGPPTRFASPLDVLGEPLPGRAPTVAPTKVFEVFPGLTLDKVTDAWAKRWPVPVTVDGALHIIRVTLPGKQGQLSAAVGQPSKDRRDEVAQILCRVKLRDAVRRPLLQTLVDGCIGPALAAKERSVVLDWLIGVDFSVPNLESRRTSGYELQAVHNSDTTFALKLFAR
ncbi:hypothetical protein [Micromonospora sp. NPDC048839]|uniref:hypothetical protein n=1 Tax=Micromonospora sp. NPDC048839 TaxID=3155641 RepID=UPI0033ECDC14